MGLRKCASVIAVVAMVCAFWVGAVAAANTSPVYAGMRNPMGNELVTHESATGKTIVVDPVYFFTS